MQCNDIPYRPIFEALIVEIFIEVIREATIRLPAPIGPTIGIVGGLVIGDAIVNAGLVSNLMVIVVAMTAISSFVVPSVEMNTTIRIIRFPFMVAATLFGFFGIAIGTLILFIHMMNQSSLKQPYLSPLCHLILPDSKMYSLGFRIIKLISNNKHLPTEGASRKTVGKLEFQFIKNSVFSTSFHYTDGSCILFLSITIHQCGWAGMHGLYFIVAGVLHYMLLLLYERYYKHFTIGPFRRVVV